MVRRRDKQEEQEEKVRQAACPCHYGHRDAFLSLREGDEGLQERLEAVPSPHQAEEQSNRDWGDAPRLRLSLKKERAADSEHWCAFLHRPEGEHAVGPLPRLPGGEQHDSRGMGERGGVREALP